MSVDEKWVPAPASGQPSITESNSDGQVTITELAPQAPSPAPFNGSAGLRGARSRWVAGSAPSRPRWSAARRSQPSSPPATRSPALRRPLRPVDRRLDQNDRHRGVQPLGQDHGWCRCGSSTTNSAYLRKLVACLVKGKYIGPGQGDLLLSPADNNVGFTPNPFVNQAVKLAGDDAAQTLLNALRRAGRAMAAHPRPRPPTSPPGRAQLGAGSFVRYRRLLLPRSRSRFGRRWTRTR